MRFHKNVFIAVLAVGFLLALSSCARCVLQGPFCNRNIMNQAMIDLDINNNARYLTDTQRKAACVTMASNFMPYTHWVVVTNQTYNSGVYTLVITTNLVTNTAFLPPATKFAVSQNPNIDQSTFDNPVANDLYGVNCNLTWQ